MINQQAQHVPPERVYVYHTNEGVRLEWVVGDWDVSLDVHLSDKSAYYHALNLKTGECVATGA